MQEAFSMNLEGLYDVLTMHHVPCTQEYVAACGREYACAFSWALPHGHLVVCQRGDQKTFRFVEHTPDLPLLLILSSHNANGPLGALVEAANASGIHSISDASPDRCGPFYVLITNFYHDHTEGTTLVVYPGIQDPRVFDFFQEAVDWIASQEAEDQRTFSPEEFADLPVHKIVTC